MDELVAQSQTVDPEVRAYVYSLVNAVGGSSTLDGRYEVGDDAIHALKDLQRWLRLYDDKTGRYDVKRCLAEANLVKGDLLEILASWGEKEASWDSKVKQRLALACLELMVPLTWPLELEEEKATINNHRHAPYIQLAQVGYKRAILQHDWAQILKTVIRIGLPSMAQARRERSRRDEGIIRLVLYFFCNISIIAQPQHLPSQGDENDISRSSTICAFHEQDVFQLLLTIGSATGEEFAEQDVILLETVFHLLKGVDPDQLFKSQAEVATREKDQLRSMLQREKAMLSGYSKHAPSRHNRFGTMTWVQRDDGKRSTVAGQTSITDDDSTLRQMDASKKWNRPNYRGKLAKAMSEHADLSLKVDVTERARKVLRIFVADFLDSSFNPVFSSLRKAIAGEASRVQRSEFRNHEVMYFYLISWFLSAERARREATAAHGRTGSAAPPLESENTFAYIAAVLDQETFILLNRCMQRAFDEKDFPALQSTLLCFTQILLTVQNMAESKDEEDQEIAENIQNRIFYEESTHDRIVQVLRGAEKFGLPYLDAVTECVHVFIRMVERYSKQNVDLQIRSKRRARRKQKQRNINPNTDTPEDAAEDIAEDTREAEVVVRERKFDFARFTNKFMTQPCIETWISFLYCYQDLSAQQLKRAHRFLYRLAFKNELSVYLFRVDILALLHRMTKGPEALDNATAGFRDFEQLVQQIFRRCIKWLERSGDNVGENWKEVAMTEMLFSKIPRTMFYLQNGYDRVVEKAAPRAPAELEIKPTIGGLEARLGVAVSLMIELSKIDSLAWVKAELVKAAEERLSWEDESEARLLLQNNQAPEQERQDEDPPAVTMAPDNADREQLLFKDKHLRLLLVTLGVERVGLAADVNAQWIIPPGLTSSDIKARLELIQKFEFAPPTYDDGKNAGDMVRSKSTAAAVAARQTNAFGSLSDDEDSGSGGDIEESMFPPNEREKRKHRDTSDNDASSKRRRLRKAVELTEEEKERRAKERKQREREKNAKIKSALRITESDEETDDEADAEFFRLEEQRRNKMSGMISKALKRGIGAVDLNVEINSARKKKKRRDTDESASEDTEDDTEDENSNIARSSSRNGNVDALGIGTDSESEGDASIADHTDEEEETPSTSPTLGQDRPLEPLPLSEVSGNAAAIRAPSRDIDGSDVDDNEPVAKVPARRNLRAGFIIDDDSDDE